MTKQTFAISLQSVNHVDRGNGVAAALERGFGRGYSLKLICPTLDGILMMLGGMALRIMRISGNLFGSNLPQSGRVQFGQSWFKQVWFSPGGLDGYQLDGVVALRQASGRYRNGITTVLKQQ
jgi:hypothetical protein